MLTRSAVLGTYFDSVPFDSNVIDDVTVTLFEDTAIVRDGQSRRVGQLAPVNTRIRFADVVLRRNGRCQVVASYASPLTG